MGHAGALILILFVLFCFSILVDAFGSDETIQKKNIELNKIVHKHANDESDPFGCVWTFLIIFFGVLVFMFICMR